jgi:hypothetical protein
MECGRWPAGGGLDREVARGLWLEAVDPGGRRAWSQRRAQFCNSNPRFRDQSKRKRAHGCDCYAMRVQPCGRAVLCLGFCQSCRGGAGSKAVMGPNEAQRYAPSTAERKIPAPDSDNVFPPLSATSGPSGESAIWISSPFSTICPPGRHNARGNPHAQDASSSFGALCGGNVRPAPLGFC